MRIEQVTLINFRGLVNVEIDFKPGFNLIVGVNGAGKSSVLEALRILLARAMPALTPAVSFPGIGLAVDDITLGRNHVTASMKFECHDQKFSYTLTEQRDETRDAVRKDKGLKDVRDAEGQSRMRRHERPAAGDPRLEGTLRGQTSTRPEVSGTWASEPDAKLRKLPQQPLVLYMSVRRAIANGRVSKGQTKAPAYQSIFDIERGLELRGFMKWWEAREAIAKEDSKSRHARELAAVRNALAVLLPELSDWCVEQDQLMVTKKVGVTQMDTMGQVLLVPESRRLPLKLLSDGERSLIVIASDIARRIAALSIDAANPLASATGVVLIDEIDLHLHPSWQREVVEKLRQTFPCIQFILTSHSPFLIQSLRDGELIRIDQEDGEFADYSDRSIEDIAENVMGIEVPQKSQRYLDMIDAAERYFRVLQQGEPASETQLASLKDHLDELSEPFSDDPAYQALLRLERVAVLGGDS